MNAFDILAKSILSDGMEFYRVTKFGITHVLIDNNANLYIDKINVYRLEAIDTA